MLTTKFAFHYKERALSKARQKSWLASYGYCGYKYIQAEYSSGSEGIERYPLPMTRSTFAWSKSFFVQLKAKIVLGSNRTIAHKNNP